MTLYHSCKQSCVWGITGLVIVLSTGDLLRAQAPLGQRDISPPVGATQFKWPTPPKDPGAPKGRRRGGAQRCAVYATGSQPKDQPTNQPQQYPSITALVPQTQDGQVWGVTHETHPTLWFYVDPADIASLSMTFVLQDAEDKEVYRTAVLLSRAAGVFSIALPSDINALAVRQRYTWTAWFTDCKDHITGRLYRLAAEDPLPPGAANTVNLAQVAQQSTQGAWHDALTSIATLRKKEPDNVRYQQAWNQLLQQVNLATIAPAPLLSCCEPQRPHTPGMQAELNAGQ